MKRSFSFRKRLQSFVYAFKGIRYALGNEHNVWIHTLAACLVILAALYFNIERWEWCFLALSIGMVFCAELLNTSIEILIDLLHPEQHPKVGLLKDVAAGGVLCAAIGAAAVGLLIFGPRILNLITDF